MVPTRGPTAPIVTLLAETHVSFTCNTDLLGVSASEFKGESTAAAAFIDSIANATSAEGITSTVSIKNVTDIAARRMLAAGSKVALKYDVLLTIIRSYAMGTTFNASDAANSAYTNFRATLLAAMADGHFSDALKRSGLAIFNNVTADPNTFTMTAYQMAVVDLSPTAAPTQSTRSSASNSDRVDSGMVVGVTIGGFAFLVLIGAFFYRNQMIKSNTSAKEKQVMPHDNVDGFLNIDEVYVPNDTVSPMGNNLPRGSVVHTDVGNATVLWETDSQASAEDTNVPLTPGNHDLGPYIEQQFSASQQQLRYSVGSNLSGRNGFGGANNASVKSLNSVDLTTDDNNIVYSDNMDIEEKGRTPTAILAMRASGESPFAFSEGDIQRSKKQPNPYNEPSTPEVESHPFFAPELFPATGEALAPKHTPPKEEDEDAESPHDRYSLEHRDSDLVPPSPKRNSAATPPPAMQEEEELSENPMLRAHHQSQRRDAPI